MHSNAKYKIIAVFLLALSAGTLWYFLDASRDIPKPQDETGLNDSDAIYTATGVTITGMDTITLPEVFENVTLTVEEVYHTAGDTVAAGEKCIKFTDDSIDRARAELERAVQSTDLAYRSKAITIGENSIQARYTYDTAMLEAEFAPQIYQDTLTQLEMQLARTESAYQSALTEYNAYLLAIENNTFYDDFGIEQLKNAYYDAYDLYAGRKKYWEMTEEDIRALSPGGQDDYQWIQKTLALLKEESDESREAYELARQNYQSEIEHAEFKLHKLLNQLEQAEQEYADAQLAWQKESLHAKTVYELTTARGQVAENNYNARLIRLANDLNQLRDARDSAAKNKASFEQMVGDGYLCAEISGTIAMLSTRKGHALTGGDSLLAYDNAGKTFVSVSMPEEEAAKLSVGGTALVTIADAGRFDGTIETIQPLAPAYHTVLVSLAGDDSALGPNLAATVVFAAPDTRLLHTAAADEAASSMFDFTLTGQTDFKATDTKYLKIAEIYASDGQQIRKGDPVCQFTPDSIENVRAALTCAQSEATAALIEAQTDYQLGVLEAGLSHNEALLEMTLAQSTYDNTIAKLNSSIQAKILETEQLLTDIYQIQLSLTDDAHRKQQAEITGAYNNAQKQMEAARESFVTSQVETVTTFQAAKKSYETFISQLEASNQQIEEKASKVYALQDEILLGQQLVEKELITAEQARDSAQTAGEIAYAKYTDSVKKYENTLGTAQAELEQATQRLNDFEQYIGDGTVYAPENGRIVEVGYQKGDFITDTQELVSYVPETLKQGSHVISSCLYNIMRKECDIP